MKTKIYILVLILLAVMGILNAQTEPVKNNNNLHAPGFDAAYWTAYANKLGLSAADKKEFLAAHQKYDQPNSHQHLAASSRPSQQRLINSNSTFVNGCINIDFESGNLNNWTPTSGFNPGYNALGCCPTGGGQQTIMSSTTALDPYGNFPVVAPGGSYSLRLGNNQTGGQADRIEQTFLVSAANANFTYRYAVVMEDPGHTVAQQPSFQIEMLDSTGVQIPCTFYSVAAGNNVPGFFSSPNTAGVVYKPWSSVVVDLTGKIGQVVTIRFTTYDCSLGGHFGYAYIDGSCMAFMTTSNDTICAGTNKTYCAPSGFLSTTWNGPGVVNNTNQCISVSAPGVYTCNTVLIPGCPGPNFTYTLSNFPKPTVSFNALSANACSQQFTFTNTSSISTGSIAAYNWKFGSSGNSSSQNPNYNFPSFGNYIVSLIATSDKGCKDTTVQNLAIYPFPVVNFSAPSACIGSNIAFANTSTIAVGSISSFTWNLGNGSSSNLLNAVGVYTSSGSYQVSLTATSNQGCVASGTNNLSIYPNPTASFNNNSLNACSQQYTFANTSSIGSGSISSYSWNFGNGSSSLPSPVYNFPSYGNYTVSMIAISNQGCKDTAVKSIAIYPFPVVGLVAPASCLNALISFTNTTTIPLGSINSYTWNFGNGNSSLLQNPTYNYSNAGTYTITLSATSNQNCITTNTTSLVVYPVPNASMTVNNLCFGNNTAFTNNSSVASGSISSSTWNFGDGNVANLFSGSHTYANSGSYVITLSVTSNQGCVATTTNTIAISPLPVISYNINNICYGNTTQFSNNSSIATGSISSYSWNFGNNNSSTLTNPTIVYGSSGSYVVSLTATSNQGCVTTATSNVVIHPLPVISFSTNKVCFGDSTQFIPNASIGSGNISSYAWSFGDGGSAAVQNPQHNYTNYGSFPVTFSATSNQNCTATYTSNITIHPLPVVSFSASNVCLGVTTNFNNGSSIPTGSISGWLWSFGSSLPTSAMQNPAYMYGGTGSYTASLKATSNNNCSSTANKVVLVYANPTASFVTKNVCFGENVILNDASSVDSPDQVTTYSWDFGNGTTSGQPNPVVTYSAGGSYPVKLTVTTNNGCSRLYIDPVTVYHLPQVNFSPTKACRNQATQFTNSSVVPLGSIAKCRWDFQNDGIWDDTLNINPVITYPMHGIYNCKLEVTSNNQCKAAKANDVTVYANPVADFTTRAVCLGDVTTFQNKSTTIDGNITAYLWDFNGDGVTDNVSQSPSITYSANGTYLVRLEVQTQFGCVNVKSQSGYINAKPVPNFVSKNNKGCPNLSVQFDNTSYIATGSIVTTQWQFGDGAMPDYSQNPSHSYAQGSYDVTLKLVSDSGCISTLVNPGFVTVYPKPVGGFAVTPDEIDENDPVMQVRSTAEGATVTHYYVNDGTSFGTENFTHTFKSIEQVKPYIVQVVRNEYNCADTVQDLLKVKPAFVIYIPNTFTPNGDGLNDGFQAKGVGITKFSIQIYDRWGHLLYETDSIDNAWDGTVRGSTDPIKQDIYVWKAKVVDIFNKSHDLSGHVSLIR